MTRALVSALLGAVLALSGCRDGARSSDQASAAEGKPPREVRLVPVQQRPLARTLLITGTLAADERVTLSTQAEGRLEAIYVDLGSQVKKGDLVAQLEQRDYLLRVEQAESMLAQARARLGLDPRGKDELLEVEETSLVKEARATLEEASANLERARQLSEQRLIARAEYDTAHATYVRAQSALANAREEVLSRLAQLRQRRSELALARKQLSDTSVRAPMDGTVEARQASTGEYLPVGSPVATLVRLNPLRLRAEVPERDAPSVAVGQAVNLTVDGQPGRFQGRVARVSPSLSEQSRTLVVEAEIENPGTLRPGSFARAEIVLEGEALAVGVPASAVVTFAGIERVLTVEGGRVMEKRVITGRRIDDFVEVLSGVAPPEQVIAEPGNLQQGEAVSVSER